jgi:hypothetical protein
MATIDVDFDVFKALTAMRSSESVSYNDVLRDVLRLGKPKQPLPPTPVNGSAVAGDWVTKGVRFPAGTEFRANHKGHTHLAKVENGALVLGGRRFDTPSSAAMAITKNSVNGWIFWECRLPNQSSWQLITALRK